MNWKRIGSGAAFATSVLWICDSLRHGFAPWSEPLSLPPLAAVPGFLILPDALIGFLLMWLYILARPRMGPGPRTAFLMATVGFALANANLINPALWVEEPVAAISGLVLGWLSFAAATYVAGWQYMEKAPD